MKHCLLALTVLAACKGETKTVEKVVTETVMERDLLLGTCLLTLAPAAPGTGHSSVAVIETADGKRAPWIVRSFQHRKPEELEQDLHWLVAAEPPKLVEGLFPTTFCKFDHPAYATFLLGNPGEPNTIVWSGKVGALVKDEAKGVLSDEARDRGIARVLEAIAKDGGTKPQLVYLPESKDVRTPGIDGRLIDAFKAAAAH